MRNRVLIGSLLLSAAVLVFSSFSVVWDMHDGAAPGRAVSFSSDSPDHPRLRLLRARERLDEVVAPGRMEFDKIVLLRRWAHGLWPSNSSGFYYPAWDAVEIIDLARRHGNYGFCAQYAIVFLQACRAQGIPVRYVNLGHFLTEVWSNEHSGWVVMDPTNDIHFERAGKPLDGLSLFEAVRSEKIAGIYKVGSDGVRTAAGPDDLRPYEHYSLLLQSNQLADPILIESNGVQWLLSRQSDYRRYPRVGRDRINYTARSLMWGDSKGRVPLDTFVLSNVRAEFDDPQNQTLLAVARRDARAGVLELDLRAHQAPDLAGFEVVHNGREFIVPQGKVLLSMAPGLNSVSARVKTRHGWLGPASSIKVFYKPSLKT